MKRFTLALILTAASLTTQAQNQPQYQNDDADAPDQGVARISIINGSVSVRQGDTGDLAAAIINAPLLAGDRILTANGSRSEVQFDYANIIRLGPLTEVRMGDLQYRRYDLQLAAGTVIFRVVQDNEADVEIATPTVSVRPTRRGVYRISVYPDGTTEVTVRAGEVDVFTQHGSEPVRAGTTLRARGNATDPEIQTVGDIPEDEFDRWSNQRDRDIDRSVSSRYVSSDIYGVDNLDTYGSWQYDAPYGNVWVPRVDAGWAPYRVGRWSYVNYYGWTWLSDDPWGWAPYHWGSWYYGGRGWAWYPGAIGPRYYWRPALVSFFGWGGGGIGIGFGGYGNIGWVPLAPFEIYRPWYGRGYGGGRNNINIVNNINIGNTYRNARFFDGNRNGATSLRAGDFGRRSIRSDNYLRVNDRDLRGAGEVRGQLPVTPGGESRRFTDRNVNARALPQSNDNASFVTRPSNMRGRQAPASTVGGGNGRNTSQPVFRGGAVDNGSPRVNSPSVNNDARGGSETTGGSRRVQQQPRVIDNSPAPSNNGGWRRLGEGTPRDNTPRENAPRGNAPRDNAPGGRSIQTPPIQDRSVQDRGNRGYREAPPVERNAPGFGRSPNNNGGAPVQISPPIVRERSSQAPPVDRGGGSRNFGRPSAPSPRMSAPPSNGGGGGGGGGARSAPPARGGGGERGGGGGGGSRGGRGR